MTMELGSGVTDHAYPSRGEARASSVPPPRPSLLRRLSSAASQRTFAGKYFAQLDAEFEGLCSAAYKESVAEEVEQLRRAPATWATNHRYEYILNAGVPEAVLRQRRGLYRQALKSLLGGCSAEAAAAFERSPAEEGAADAQRHGLLGVLSEVQRLRQVRSEFERLRNCLFVVVALVGVALGVFFILTPELPITISTHVVMAGVLGAYFSVLLRLGALQFRDEYLYNYHQVDGLFYNLLVTFALSLFEGGVGAFLLYTAFLAGMLEGSMFPSFASELTHAAANHVSDLVSVLPASKGETAKLLVWSVLAGFCERLVPDTLHSFKERALAAKQAAVSAEPLPPAQ
jgi:hypothetical protein